MSVIENALRRAQAPSIAAGAPAAPPSAPPPAVATEVPAARTRSRAKLRAPTFATLLLIVLAGATFIVLRQPGWGEGFERFLTTAPEPAPSVQTITRQFEPPVVAEPVAASADAPPVIGPAVDLRALLDDSVTTLQNAALKLAAAAPTVPADQPQERFAPAPQAAFPTVAQPVLIPEPARSAARLQPVVSPTSRYRLGGIMLSGKTRLAIINDVIVAEGQRIDDAVVRSVGHRSVTLEVSGKSYTLPLRGATP